jgi:hypothetical protein
MSDQDEKDTELTTRDQFALSAMNGLLAQRDWSWLYAGEIQPEFEPEIKVLALMAYKIADAMRAARLQAFE